MSDEIPRGAARPHDGPVRGAAALAVIAILVTGCGGGQEPVGATSSAEGGESALPQATTYTTLDGLPRDPAPSADVDGTVVHPNETAPVSAKPAAPAVAELPATQLKGP
ncbi:hypothetical protein E1281_35965, partial [Actinomadura sp. KC345]